MWAAISNSRLSPQRESQGHKSHQRVTLLLSRTTVLFQCNHSTLSPREVQVDSLISLTTPTWLPRLEMVTRLSNGSSTTRLAPFNLLPRPTTHGISKELVLHPTCRYGLPTRDGSRSSNSLTDTSSTRRENTLMPEIHKQKVLIPLLPQEMDRNLKIGKLSTSQA